MKNSQSTLFLKNKSTFTLVELIIVITILAILATIAFVSFQNYVRDSRDSNRLATLKNIETGLQTFQIKTGNYPEVENATVLQASGVTFSFQGYIGDRVSKQIQINTTPKDPLDQSHFIYATNDKKNSFQILTFLENKASAYIPETLAQNYSQRIIKTLGNNVGIILNQDNSPITQTTLDILQNNSGSVYSVLFQNNDQISLSGVILFSNIFNRRSDLIKNKNLWILDSSLVTYWDMETTIETSPNVYQIKNLANNNYNIPCYNNGTLVSCGSSSLGPQFINNGNFGKALFFDGVDDYLYSNSSFWNNFINDIDNYSISFLMETKNIGRNSIIGHRYGDSMNIFQDSDGNISMNLDDTRYNSPKTNTSITGLTSVTITFKNAQANSQAKIYINGEEKTFSGSTWDGSGMHGSWQMYIGWQGRQEGIEYPGFYHGTIDEVKIYNRLLNAREISTLYYTLKE